MNTISKSKKNHFPWTPGGLELLEMINNIIENNGGLERMHILVFDEIEANSYKIDQRKIEEIFKMVLKYKISQGDGAKISGISDNRFVTKFNDYKDKLGIKPVESKVQYLVLSSKMNDKSL